MIQAADNTGLSSEEIKRKKNREARKRYWAKYPEKLKAMKQRYAKRKAAMIAAYQKAYRQRKKSELSAQRKAHYEANKAEIYAAQRRSIAKNREKTLAYLRKYNNNPEYLKRRRENRRLNPPSRAELDAHNARARRDYYKNREKSLKRVMAYRAKRRKTDPAYRILQNLRVRISNVIRGRTKSASSMQLIGCTKEELKAHLEKQFLPGMTWENYGPFGWHCDHVAPCASFRMEDPEEQRKCFSFKNLQPLWWIDNIRKKDKIAA